MLQQKKTDNVSIIKIQEMSPPQMAGKCQANQESEALTTNGRHCHGVTSLRNVRISICGDERIVVMKPNMKAQRQS